jgi:hypothetical protein
MLLQTVLAMHMFSSLALDRLCIRALNVHERTTVSSFTLPRLHNSTTHYPIEPVLRVRRLGLTMWLRCVDVCIGFGYVDACGQTHVFEFVLKKSALSCCNHLPRSWITHTFEVEKHSIWVPTLGVEGGWLVNLRSLRI